MTIQFLAGMLCYFLSHLMEIFIFFKPHIAKIVAVPFAVFTVLIIYYTVTITAKLRVKDSEGVLESTCL